MNWLDIQARAAQPPQILPRWRAEREAQRAIRNAAYPTSSGTYGSQLYEWLTGGQVSNAGVAVTEQTAMGVSAVYACISLIAGTIASLPLHVYERLPDGSRQRADLPLWWLLNEQPCPQTTAAVFWEYLITSLLLYGDAFALIRRRGKEAIGFEPLHPMAVSVTHDADRERLIYTILDDGRAVAVQQDDILHIPGIGFDGLRGMSPIRYAAKQAIGTAIAADQYQARFFSNGARPDFALTTAGKLTDEQIEQLRNTWQARFGGVAKSHLPAILTGGLDVKPLGMTSEDAQLIATRQFQVIDIARIYGVPPFMIGETDKTSSWGSGVEQMGIGFVKYTLMPRLVKIAQEINRKLWPARTRYFVEHATAALERGDVKSRYEAHRVAVGRAGEPGFMTVNEIRRLENLPPIEGGDTLNNGSDPNAPPAEAAAQ